MQLFHFSDDPDIMVFEPRPILVPRLRRPGQGWLNGLLVWAIAKTHQGLYLFPRNCPRILIWAKKTSSKSDRQSWLGPAKAVAYIEQDWLEPLQAATLHRYDMPSESFEDLHDAGMWVSRQAVVPSGRRSVTHLDGLLEQLGVELRVVDSLMPLKLLWQTSLHVSGIRLSHAKDVT